MSSLASQLELSVTDGFTPAHLLGEADALAVGEDYAGGLTDVPTIAGLEAVGLDCCNPCVHVPKFTHTKAMCASLGTKNFELVL